MEPQYKSSAVNTPYDDVFRTMLNDCSSLIIPVINEVSSKIEHFLKFHRFSS